MINSRMNDATEVNELRYHDEVLMLIAATSLPQQRHEMSQTGASANRRL